MRNKTCRVLDVCGQANNHSWAQLPALSLAILGFATTPLVAQPGDAVDEQSPRPLQQDVALSPAAWDSDARRFFELFEAVAFQDVEKPIAEGRHGAVTGTTGTTGVYAALKALEQGGTAADAVVTAMLTQVVTAAGSYVSYGGMMNVMYYDAETRSVHNLNAGLNSVLGETDPLSIPPAASGRTALVPGFMRGAEALHSRFGRLPWASLFEPAIYYAEEGFEVPPLIARYMSGRAALLRRLPEARAIFTRENGEIYGEGDRFRQEGLARTLRGVAERGANYMYEEDWAEQFVAVIQREGGKITMDDLRAYEAIWAEPVPVIFGGMEIYGPGAPGRGGTRIAEALNVANEAGLIARGSIQTSAESFYWLSQIMKIHQMEFWDQDALSALLPDLNMELSARSTPAHANLVWDLIEDGRLPNIQVPQSPTHSDAVVAVDQWGNIAAATHSIVTAAWGSSGIFVDGVSINDAAVYQLPVLARASPGSRALDHTQPLIVMKNRRPVIALSSIGSLYPVTLSVLMNLATDYPDLGKAIDAPLLHGVESDPHTVRVHANMFESALLDEVRAMGAGVEEQSQTGGYVVGISIDPESGMRRAVGARRLSVLPLAH